MRIYIINKPEGLTNHWHDGGGCVIVANDEKHVRELADKHNENQGKYGKFVYIDENDLVKFYELVPGDYEPCVLVFPNAGCC